MCVSTIPVQSAFSSFVIAAKFRREVDVSGKPFMLLKRNRKLLGSFVVWSSPKCLSTARGCSGCIEGSDLSRVGGVAGGGSIDDVFGVG
jgi:hypothetical protein